MTWKIRNLLEEVAQLAIVVVFITLFAGFFGWVGYEIGRGVGEGDGFIQAYNYIKDMEYQH